MSNGTPNETARQVEVLISPAIAADYEQRGVFIELRPENSAATSHDTPRGVLYEVSRLTAARLLEDALLRYRDRTKRRGLGVAYSTHIDKLCKACGWVRGRYDPLHELPAFHELIAMQPMVASLFVKLGIPSATEGR